MVDVMRVSEIRALLLPMFRNMLRPDECTSFRLEIVPVDASHGSALEDDDLVERNSAVVRWRILGEHGWSGGLRVDEGPTVLVRAVKSDLQDFIAESHFGWGQLRGPRDLL